MKFKAVWGESNNPILWIGPIENLKSEPRKFLKPMEKQKLLRDQNYECNFCDNRIKLYPYSTCDSDHIIPIHIGGKTTIENMQLLCVSCHRQKSARELKCTEKTIITEHNFGSDVMIGKNIEFKFPCEKMTPKETIDSQMNEMCLLTYKRKSREYRKDEVNYINILEKFKFVQ